LFHCVEAARGKKAEDVLVLDLRGLSDFTDYFVICHGSSDRQVLAIAEAVEERLSEELGVKAGHVEGRRTGDWILLDYIDFVVHVFHRDKRAFYALERLWGDAPQIDVAAEAAAPARRARSRRSRPSASS
jgi:ribosome-associated protein